MVPFYWIWKTGSFLCSGLKGINLVFWSHKGLNGFRYSILEIPAFPFHSPTCILKKERCRWPGITLVNRDQRNFRSEVFHLSLVLVGGAAVFYIVDTEGPQKKTKINCNSRYIERCLFVVTLPVLNDFLLQRINFTQRNLRPHRLWYKYNRQQGVVVMVWADECW